MIFEIIHMNTTERFFGHIECCKCFNIIPSPLSLCQRAHLVCLHCRTHQVPEMTTNVPVECTLTLLQLDIKLNKILEHDYNICKYGCGFKEKGKELRNHEVSCTKKGKEVRCYICKNSQWLCSIVLLQKHVQMSHPDNITDLTDPRDSVVIEAKNPIMLIQRYNTFLYWVRYRERGLNSYILVWFLGQTSLANKEDQSLTEFSVSSARNPKYFVKDKVLVLKKSILGNDPSICFDMDQGTCISKLEGNEYNLSLSNHSRQHLMLDDLTCIVCMKILYPPIRICYLGHSLCGECSQKLIICPQCKMHISIGRNFAMEAIVEQAIKTDPRMFQKSIFNNIKNLLIAGVFFLVLRSVYRKM